jgi:hypothetical protein
MKKIKNTFWILVSLAPIVCIIYKIAINQRARHIPKDRAVRIRAAIINEKNYLPNQPVEPEFSYSYEFTVAGKTYRNNAHDISLTLGDTIDVEYDRDSPGINSPLNPKD